MDKKERNNLFLTILRYLLVSPSRLQEEEEEEGEEEEEEGEEEEEEEGEEEEEENFQFIYSSYNRIVPQGFSLGKFGLPCPGEASCDRVALHNRWCMLGI